MGGEGGLAAMLPAPLESSLKKEKKMSANQIMKYFEFRHLPEKLQEVSKPFCDVAQAMDTLLPDSAEKSAGLRKLLEAKDCFVRAAL